MNAMHHDSSTKGANRILAIFAPRRARFATLIAVLVSVVGAGTALVAGPGTAFAADETFSKTSTITVPGGLNSFDIGFVDPELGLYFLADRTNATIDQVVTSTNAISQLAKGSFVGVQPGAETSGPNGVITANDHSEVWAADGVLCAGPCGATTPATQTSRIQVIDVKTGKVTHTIDNGGQRRADELCEDPQHHLVLVANDNELDLFLTFISTETYKVVGKKLHLDGTDRDAQNVKATNGIEQCQWNPRTKKFYLAIPEVNGSGANTTPGAVLEINPASRKVEKVFPIDFGFVAGPPATADCLGPQGLAIGPQREILLGCSNAGKGSVIINELNGDLVRNLPGLNGNDEVWFNPGDNHYFLAGSNHNLALPKPGPILGVVDQSGDPDAEDAAPTTAAGSHSVAADPFKNQVYVPGNFGATALCGGSTGCIAVFTTTNDDHR
ncbi:MAG: hypothetical protein E6J54_28370 [Deltaproteobacteria bacterium]|nr:MAG: hypothetical protein E6J54_28370 [Deltaproteobacteria bacterium]